LLDKNRSFDPSNRRIGAQRGSGRAFIIKDRSRW
jgi:hypothetical protein